MAADRVSFDGQGSYRGYLEGMFGNKEAAGLKALLMDDETVCVARRFGWWTACACGCVRGPVCAWFRV